MTKNTGKNTKKNSKANKKTNTRANTRKTTKTTKKTSRANLSRKRIVIAVVLLLIIAAGSFILIKYPERVKRAFSRIFEGEGKITSLTEEKIPDDWTEIAVADIAGRDQSMLLINTEHTIPADFMPDIAEYKDSEVRMNTCVMDAYETLAQDVFEKFAQKLYIRSAYRSAEEQLQQLEENSDKATAVGASEHQAGLALDVYVPQYAGMGFVNCEAGRWVNENCDDYGFIIRYPSYGEKTTGITYEPWHLRYVGQPHARIIMDSKSTLEGYYDYLHPYKLYRFENFYIIRTNNETVKLPREYKSVIKSPDNQGGYIITIEAIY